MNIIIFAGGIGSRLWPLSRKNTPKQFEQILGEKSTLQLAAERLQPDFPWDNLYVSTGAKYIETVQQQLPLMPSSHVIGEPTMRDVGPAVGMMAAILAKINPLEPMVILWSDHLVRREEHFRKILRTAGEIISEDPDKIVFVAQTPRFASENLGWIDHGEKVSERNDISLYSFVNFKYRPDATTARDYFNSGHYTWNLGYFVTTPQFLLQQYEKFAPELYKGIKQIGDAWGSEEFQKVLDEVYPTLEKINFDNAILEKLDPKDGFVISENIEWSDIGAWEALKEALAKDKDENVTKGDVVIEDGKDSLIYNFTNQLIVGIDLDDMVVVNTQDVLLVCPKGSVPKIKKFVEKLEDTEHKHLA